ncbi:MAG TPA: hypothetical protein VNZ45_06425 [Bacteroidia bacterium]|nr:hypothetical protein [Bacteroidia bacterium]
MGFIEEYSQMSEGRISYISKETFEVSGWQLFLFFGTVAFGASIGWHLGSEIVSGTFKEINK